MIHSYLAYGLGIHTPFPVPEFMAAAMDEDVIIRLENNYFVPADVVNEEPYLTMNKEEATLFVKGVGLFRVRGGREVIINAAPNVDDSLIRIFLTGIIMAIVLCQRDQLVLHASVVEVEGRAVAFMGQSGWGKSSTAAAMHARGHTIISDDVMAVSLRADSVTVKPAFPQFKINLEVANLLGYNTDKLFFIHPLEEKQACRIEQNFPTEPLSLKCLYVLGGGTVPEVKPLQSQQSVIELISHLYITNKFEGAAQLQQCAELVRRVPVYRLKRPHSLARLPEIAQLVEEHLEAVI